MLCKCLSPFLFMVSQIYNLACLFLGSLRVIHGEYFLTPPKDGKHKHHHGVVEEKLLPYLDNCWSLFRLGSENLSREQLRRPRSP